jgi:IS30 family transposase
VPGRRINRRTGARWRHGRTVPSSNGRPLHYPAVVSARKSEISDRYLSEDERVRIADLHRSKHTVRAIATELGRSPSTISRELRRNRDEGSGQYRPFACAAVGRRTSTAAGSRQTGQRRGAARVCGRATEEAVESRADQPRPAGGVPPSAAVASGAQIYQAVYRPELGGLARQLPGGLRTGRRRRKPHRRPDARRAGSLAEMTMIDQRPAEATDRSEPGHWEGDLITGEQNRSAIGTLVDRHSRFTMLLHLPGRHTAEAVRDALVAAFAGLPPELRRSLTWDQGKELAMHAQIAEALGMPVFFCDPHSPWQRPSNENTACCASTSPRAATFAPTTPNTWARWQPSSTSAHARRWLGAPRPNCSPHMQYSCRLVRRRRRQRALALAHVRPRTRDTQRSAPVRRPGTRAG